MIRHISPPPYEIRANCGWTDYRRDELSDLLATNEERTDRVVSYVNTVYNNSEHTTVLALDPSDIRAIKLPLFMAGVALQRFGNEQSSILQMKETVKSDECTNYIVDKISQLGASSNQLVTVDARHTLRNNTETARGQSILAAIHAVTNPKYAVKNPNLYFAVLGGGVSNLTQETIDKHSRQSADLRIAA